MSDKMLTNWRYEGGYEEPLAKEVYECSDCGYPINDGDTYYEIEGGKVCEDCLIDYTKIADINE